MQAVTTGGGPGTGHVLKKRRGTLAVAMEGASRITKMLRMDTDLAVEAPDDDEVVSQEPHITLLHSLRLEHAHQLTGEDDEIMSVVSSARNTPWLKGTRCRTRCSNER